MKSGSWGIIVSEVKASIQVNSTWMLAGCWINSYYCQGVFQVLANLSCHHICDI